ncbi:hypothetical protein [Actinorugispora endophytica]|uniref:PH (Pleckstrin Homology) domain-containing protein n=1 Tax=Actinorugispora endophytica TaxID=1605990 RepID=A0A4V3D8Z3_9ACTN|nr:hypothetical protein [Actinorugispora endophytica]TDQ53770.1 hypothetical protein EV190_103221 [Actinorugispora endophytica]
MKVRHARWIPVSVWIAGAALLALGAWLCATADYETGVPVIAAGAAGSAYALLQWRLPYFVLTDTQMVLPLQLGPYRRTGIGGPDRLAVEGDRVVVIAAGNRRVPLPVWRHLAHPADWAELAARLPRRGGPDPRDREPGRWS